MAECCTCYSSWKVENTYIKGYAQMVVNPLFNPYRISKGQTNPPEAPYPYGPAELRLDSGSPPKYIPWQLKLLNQIYIPIDSYGSSSACDCTSALGAKLIDTSIKEDWHVDPDFSSTQDFIIKGTASWWDIPLWQSQEKPKLTKNGKVEIQWLFHRKLYRRIEVETYEAKHKCGPSCPSGPAPCVGSTEQAAGSCYWKGNGSYEFGKWIPVWN
jgi:hypothetical protein